MSLLRSAANPIVTPGLYPWRRVAVFNPGAIASDGQVFLLERAAGSLRPFQTAIGLLTSTDGVDFSPAQDKPVLTAEMLGYAQGSVQDARIVRIDGRYLVTYALQPYPIDCWPNGVGIPDYYTDRYPDWQRAPHPMISRSGIAASDDLIEFHPLGFTTPADIDDRDNVLFPEEIGGRFALLRRPTSYVGAQYGAEAPGIWISYSVDLMEWSAPKLLAQPEQWWEATKIGAGPPPIKTDRGWLLIYHGVDDQSVYRIGLIVLDLHDIETVVARTVLPILEPQMYYERFGLIIPNVVFPTGAVLRGDQLFIYYGCTDTSIALATAPIEDLLELAFRPSSNPQLGR